MSSKNKSIQIILTVLVLMTVILSSFQSPLPASAQGEQGDGIVRDYNTETGNVTMISGENNEPIVVLSATQARMSSQRQADVLVQTFAPEFGITDPASDLQMAEQDQPSENRVTTRYQQVYNDVPVIAGELIVNANEQGALSSMSGEVAQDLSLDTTPTINSDSAVEIAKQGMVKWYDGELTDYVHTEAVLSIFDEKLLRPSIRPAELVWKIEMVPTDQMQPIREFVVVSAKTGNIPLHFNQIDTEWSNVKVSGGVNQPPKQEEITPTPMATDIPVTETPVPTETTLATETPVPTEASLPTDISPLIDTSSSDVDALAVTRYVKASSGSNANTCLSVALACATINGAIGKSADGDTIKVETGIFTGTGTEVVLINKSITLSGGWNATFTSQSGMSTIDGQGVRRGIAVSTGTVIVDHFSIQNGFHNSQGGGIRNDGGILTLSNSIVSGNVSQGMGGGIFNYGTLTINNTSVTGNSAGNPCCSSGGGGGGIENWNSTLTLNNSLVNANTLFGVYQGSGIGSAGIVILNNSTVSSNTGGNGVGISADGTVVLNNSTISENQNYGILSNDILTLQNTIIARNGINGDCRIWGTINSQGHNLIGNNLGCAFVSTIGDLVGTSANPINPRLTPLQDNGGTTLTYALMGGSPAINAGNPASCFSTDQRGVARPQGTTCDIGAFEYQPGTTPSSISVLQGSPQTIGLGTVASQNFSVVVSDASGAGIPAITVTFTASLSGPSGVFGNTGTNMTTAITGFNGVATASTFTANTTFGSYTVQATVNGLAGSASFDLTNSNGQISTYTANNTSSLPGTFLCNQSQPNCTNGSNPHADAAHKYAIGTYGFYLEKHDRDSIENNGMTIISTVHYDSGYDNAYWSGDQIVYGDAEDFPLADDVVAHELTHGVTQYESNLYYFYQSGAINESFSDLWGEYYDQNNGVGTDTAAVKWLQGEDILPGGNGALRNMSNPPEFSDPDKMTSPLYNKTDEDNGGVHYNSGINNKAVYLMVDGDTFNGFTITGIGWDKTAAIYYEVNTNLLFSGADYSDLYYAVQQACTNLSLTNYKGITSADCAQVKQALDAVEMNSQPAPDFNVDAAICKAGVSNGVALNLFSDDFEKGTGKWVASNSWALADFYAASPIHMMYGDDYTGSSTSALQMKTPVTLPAGASYLSFKHAYQFESDGSTYYDGGVFEYSINNGSTWVDANTLFSSGQNYNGTVYTSSGSSSTLQGRLGFVGDSHGYTSTRYTLTSLAGKNVKFRWVFSTDQFVGYFGWVVDDVKVYTCVASPPIPAYVSPANNALTIDYTPLLDWSNVTPYIDHYQVQIATENTTFATPVYDVNNLLTSQFTVPSDLNPNTTYYWRVRAFNVFDETKGWTIARTFRTALLPPTPLIPPSGTPLLTNRPTFDWVDVPGATNYTIQASTVPTFASFSINATAATSTYTPIVDLPAKKTIHWRVRSNGTNGPSAWSSVFTLTTANPPSIPALVAPTENLLISTTLTPTKLDWGKSTVPVGVTLDHYHVQVATDAAFSAIVTEADVTGPALTDFSSYDVSMLVPNTKYYWRVSSFNSVGQYSSWSLTRSFRTALLAPTLTLPASGTALLTNRPTFDWADVPGATNYTIQASTVPTFASFSINTTAATSTYTPTIDLPAKKTIHWRVRSNGTNGPSAWSSVFTLTTANPPSIPALVAPTENLLIFTTLTPTKLDWGKSTVPVDVTLDHYHVQVATDAAFSANVTEADVTGPALTDFSSYDVSTLVPNTKYYWRVSSFSSAGQYSSWSLTRSFRIAMLPPVLTSPSGATGSLNLKPPFDWEDVAGATSYTIQVSKGNTFSTLLVNASAATSAYTPTVNLPAGTPLYWRVRTNGANGPSKWSVPVTFIIQ